VSERVVSLFVYVNSTTREKPFPPVNSNLKQLAQSHSYVAKAKASAAAGQEESAAADKKIGKKPTASTGRMPVLNN
jgi:hypothetical protein